ncbi:MAG: type II toxin-antitoxin system prevent-host-death family antitoxin [Methylococcales bacterium]|jgi:prevent-host-death family protein|nr:type II toxin-antitoxin system prevent-host-death family antitoxin [Methylococcales bacterium]MBT7411072.1 type II toxin-antitoxin system prevent-host-death family antitoxin [Methylococcales bacterium]
MKVNIDNAATNLSELVKLANDGDEIILTESGQPMARIIPYQLKVKAGKSEEKNSDDVNKYITEMFFKS